MIMWTEAFVSFELTYKLRFDIVYNLLNTSLNVLTNSHISLCTKT
jgi:hypothetical protein